MKNNIEFLIIKFILITNIKYYFKSKFFINNNIIKIVFKNG